MIMRFRPANIRLINRRSTLPRLLLALSSKDDKDNYNDKNNNPTDVQRLTGHSISTPEDRRVVKARDGKIAAFAQNLHISQLSHQPFCPVEARSPSAGHTTPIEGATVD